ncbi:unnamed protein product [Clavelina lepadiformis]|uniref:Uncharacterized protein n=1 Tax=Clavelina lepadiformis TaxID=159417 RepID=A0ABP0FGG4_CLALP
MTKRPVRYTHNYVQMCVSTIPCKLIPMIHRRAFRIASNISLFRTPGLSCGEGSGITGVSVDLLAVGAAEGRSRISTADTDVVDSPNAPIWAAVPATKSYTMNAIISFSTIIRLLKQYLLVSKEALSVSDLTPSADVANISALYVCLAAKYPTFIDETLPDESAC